MATNSKSTTSKTAASKAAETTETKKAANGFEYTGTITTIGKELGFTGPENEKGDKMTWVSLEKVAYDSKTGKKLSTPRIQAVAEKSIPVLKEGWKKLGYTANIVYKPAE